MDGVFSNREPQLLVCGDRYSFFFDLIDREWRGANSQPMHRVCSLMRKLHVTHLCREELILDPELLQEKADLETRTEGIVDFQAVRFSFFRIPDGSSIDWRQVAEADLLGYAVIATIQPHGNPHAQSYMYESVVRPPTIWDAQGGSQAVSNYYVRGQKEFRTTLGLATDHRQLSAPGSFFCQQNGLTHVCAHAALRTAINSSPVYGGPKITPKRINDIVGKDHTPLKRVGRYKSESVSTGLSAEHMLQVGRSLGFQPQIAEFALEPLVDYEEFIYPLVESGIPTILGLHPERVAHVVAVLGHTHNSDRWLPDARQVYNTVPYETTYASAAAWTDHFIVSDDNLGALVTLPTDSVRNLLIPKYNAGLHAALAIGLAPSDVTISGYVIEKRAINVFTSFFRYSPPGSTATNRWISYMRSMPSSIPRVCRTTLRQKADYMQAMSEAVDECGNRLDANELNFIDAQLDRPEFWVTEFTLPSLYTGNRHKLGDVICAANLTNEQFRKMEGLMLAWAPGRLLHRNGGTDLTQVEESWSLAGHTPLLGRRPEQCSALEW